MRGDPLARQWRVIRAIETRPSKRSHAQAQRAPSEIFRSLLSSLDILSTPSDAVRKTIKTFSASPPLRLGVKSGDACKQI
jgi:hypothetical protein